MAQSEKGCALFVLREGKIKMRLDKFLKVSRLIKRRTVANEACDAGRVLINGAVAKASTKVKKGEKVQLVGFGTFEVSERAAREGRNPQTGKTMKIEACKAPKFKAGKALKDVVNA